MSVRGATGHERPATLKVSIGYRDGYIGEGQISYAGPGAVARARLALRIVEERLRLTGVRCREMRFELIGVDALHGPPCLPARPSRTRFAPASSGAPTAPTRRCASATRWRRCTRTGPAAGGGATRQVREVIGVASAFLPRERVSTAVQCLEVTR